MELFSLKMNLFYIKTTFITVSLIVLHVNLGDVLFPQPLNNYLECLFSLQPNKL